MEAITVLRMQEKKTYRRVFVFRVFGSKSISTKDGQERREATVFHNFRIDDLASKVNLDKRPPPLAALKVSSAHRNDAEVKKIRRWLQHLKYFIDCNISEKAMLGRWRIAY